MSFSLIGLSVTMTLMVPRSSVLALLAGNCLPTMP
jgi:hypothetical protein